MGLKSDEPWREIVEGEPACKVCGLWRYDLGYMNAGYDACCCKNSYGLKLTDLERAASDPEWEVWFLQAWPKIVDYYRERK